MLLWHPSERRSALRGGGGQSHGGPRDAGIWGLTTIDVEATLKAKLGVEFRRYVILGACNPALAYQALTQEAEIGLLLPCNVIVYEEENGGATVSAMNALAAMKVTSNPALEPIAQEAKPG